MKPEIHQDEAVGELSDSAFRLFIGLITQADDAGRLKGNPRLIGAQVWPYQPKAEEEVDEWLAELDRAGLILRYAHAGRPYICLPSWNEHQRVDNAGRSRIPEPDEGCRKVSPRTAARHREPPLDQGPRTKDQGSGSKDQGPGKGSSAPTAADAPLSYLLADLIERNGSKRPTVTKRWADAERLLLERDGRDRTEAERLIQWCQADEFWRGNVLSMPKFREKYDRLRLNASRNGGPGRGSGEHPADCRIRESLEGARG